MSANVILALLFGSCVAGSVLWARKRKPKVNRPVRPDFVASRDISIVAFDRDSEVAIAEEGRRYRFASRGLSKRGLPELEIVDVPSFAATPAAILINNIAEYIVTTKSIANGQTWANSFAAATVAVRCFESKRDEASILRIVDVDNTDGAANAPLLAIATLQYISAMQKIEDGEDEEGVLELKKAVEIYPGDPKNRVYKFSDPMFNQNNYLSYVALAKQESAEPKWYLAALNLSDVFTQAELGADSLPVLTRETLAKDALAIAEAVQKHAGGKPWGEARLKESENHKGAEIMALLASPIPKPGGRQLSFAPIPFRRYYYEQPVSGKLLSRETADLAADIYLRYQPDPSQLLLLVKDTVGLMGGDEEAPSLQTEIDTLPCYQPHHMMLGAILADIGRKLAAGLSENEIRAVFKLNNAPIDGAMQKLEFQQAEETKWMMAAIGM